MVYVVHAGDSKSTVPHVVWLWPSYLSGNPMVDGSIVFGKIVAIPFEELDDESLEQIRKWRNDSRVRTWMNNDTVIAREDHIRFCRSLRHRNDARYYRVDTGDRPIGVVNLSRIDRKNRSAELGLYKIPTIDAPGTGSVLMETIHGIARAMGIQTLRLQVRVENARAFRLYEKTGYTVTGYTDTHILMERKL